jgi:hypothetical protein
MLRPMRKAIVSIVRSAAMVAVLSPLFACGSSGSDAKGNYGEECTATDDCVSGLMCLGKLCTLQCNNSDSLCQAKDPASSCVSGVCANKCVDKRDCPSGLQCVTTAFGMTCGVQ